MDSTVPSRRIQEHFCLLRTARADGREEHYPLRKMLSLAVDGVTSLSIKPISIIAAIGIVVSLLGLIGIVWAIVMAVLENAVAGWGSIVCIMCFLSGVQLLSLGIIGEYIVAG